MNIYNFIASPDIATYCEKIGHIFNTLEMAVIIAHSDKTIKGKHTAWRELISDYPDMPIHCSFHCVEIESLHDYFRKLVALEEKLTEEFLTPCEKEVYRFSICSHGKYKDDSNCFSTFQKAWSDLCESWDWNEDKITSTSFFKEIIDIGKNISVSVNSDCEILDIYYYGLDRQADYVVAYELKDIFIHLPVPFVKGDLVALYADDEKPYVLKSLPHWRTNYHDNISGEGGDGSDMAAVCYSLQDDGAFFSECFVYSLVRLRYFRGELRGQQCFLRYLSQYHNFTSLIVFIFFFG